MIRSLAPALVVLAALAGTATAERVRTYAYIADVSVRSDAGPDGNKYYCTFTVQVPRTRLDRAPDGAGTDLLAGATSATDVLTQHRSDEFDCTDVAHTWQAVTFDPRHPDRVDIAFPAARPDWGQRILFVVIILIVGSAIAQRLTGKSVSLAGLLWRYPVWASRRRRERIEARTRAIREKRMPRAQVVESGRTDPPAD